MEVSYFDTMLYLVNMEVVLIACFSHYSNPKPWNGRGIRLMFTKNNADDIKINIT
jgi:hypothetical protein